MNKNPTSNFKSGGIFGKKCKFFKPLKVPSLARSLPKPLRVRSVPKPLKVPSLARPVQKPLKVPSLARSVLKPLNVPKSDLDLDDDHKI